MAVRHEAGTTMAPGGMGMTDATNDNPNATLLAVHSGALGDVILFGHLLRRLEGRATILAGGEKGKLLAGLGAAGRALDFDAVPMHEIFTDTPLDLCRLPALLGPHDRLVSCFGEGDRRAELRLAAACGAADAAFLPVRPPDEFAGHLLDLWADLLGLAPPDRNEAEPWPVPDAWRESAAEALRADGVDPEAPYVLLAPGAGAEEKRWPLRRFVELARLCGTPREEGDRHLRCAADPVRVFPARPVFVVGPVEYDRWPDESIEALRSEFPLLTCPPLPVLAAVAAGAEGVVANDSGVGHLAAALGTKTISLFGPTRAEHFAPIGRDVRVIARPALGEIRVEEVLALLGA